MAKKDNLIGLKFGKLTVVKDLGVKNEQRIWLCECECGGSIESYKRNLTSGKLTACGECSVENLTGKKFGIITVIKKASQNKKGASWLCKCQCGNIVKRSHSAIINGRVKSCGCIAKHWGEKHRKRLKIIYKGMILRCYNQDFTAYKNYGGRGIKICESWLNDFDLFYLWSLNNGYSENLTIDRIDVNGDYEPNNCCWVDNITQQNNKRTNTLITYNDKTMTLAQWATELNISQATLRHRIFNSNLPFDEIMTPNLLRNRK